MKRNCYEHQQQAALFQWAKIHESMYPQLRWIYAIPNAARRSPQQGAWMKAEGMRKGIWDIHLPEPVQQYHGLFIEMKSPSNKLTPEQEQFRNDKQHQYYFALCYDWIVARDTIILYLAGERF